MTIQEIAYAWHSGGGSPLYQFASAGTINNPTALLEEIDECLITAHWDTYANRADRSRTMNELRQLRRHVEERIAA